MKTRSPFSTPSDLRPLATRFASFVNCSKVYVSCSPSLPSQIIATLFRRSVFR